MLEPDHLALLNDVYATYASPPRAPTLDAALAAVLDMDLHELRHWVVESRAMGGPAQRLQSLSREARPTTVRAAWERLAARNVIPESWIDSEERSFVGLPNGLGLAARSLSHPATLLDCVLLAADAQVVSTAEAMARECVSRGLLFHGRSPSAVRWLSCQRRCSLSPMVHELILCRAFTTTAWERAREDLMNWERDRVGEASWQQWRNPSDESAQNEPALFFTQSWFEGGFRVRPRIDWPLWTDLRPEPATPERCWTDDAIQTGMLDATWRAAARNGDAMPSFPELLDRWSDSPARPWGIPPLEEPCAASERPFTTMANPFAPKLELLALGCFIHGVTQDTIDIIPCAPLR